ncbi:MAG: sensor histidine kinase [Ruminococcaceae bacterium]|nr:sensor histidine kinase [Oscillospiraceae bacterium]
MNNSRSQFFDLTMLATFKNLVSISHESLYSILLKYSLPPEASTKLRTADLCNFQINRMCNIVEYLISPDCTLFTEEPKSFDAFELFSEITKSFSETVSKYITIKTECYSKLSKPMPFMVNKMRFELMLLNLFYCCLNASEPDKNHNLKLTLYVTETKNSLIFHLRDNCKAVNPSIIENVFSKNQTLFTNGNTYEDLVALSLSAARKASSEMNGKLTYKSLKNGNRYDITVSKDTDINTKLVKAPSKYEPTTKIYEEIFAYLEFEYQLSLIEKGDFQ